MALASYHGPATLAADGQQVEVDAHLVSDDEPGQRRGWAGFVKCPPDALSHLLGTTVTIRLPNDREGTVLVRRGGKVVGTGSPPFGDHTTSTTSPSPSDNAS